MQEDNRQELPPPNIAVAIYGMQKISVLSEVHLIMLTSFVVTSTVIQMYGRDTMLHMHCACFNTGL